MLLSALRLRSRGFLVAAALSMSLAAARPAIADDAPPATANAEPAASQDVHDSIDKAMDRERAWRALSVAGMLAGTGVVLGGTFASAYENKDSSRHSNTGYYIAAGVGLPLLGASIYLFSETTREISRLSNSRVGLGYSPDTHQPMLQASIGF